MYMYVGDTNTIAIPIYRVLPYPVMEWIHVCTSMGTLRLATITALAIRSV